MLRFTRLDWIVLAAWVLVAALPAGEPAPPEAARPGHDGESPAEAVAALSTRPRAAHCP